MGPQLTTLGILKGWGNVQGDTNDLLLTRLIQRISQGIFSYLNRPTLFLSPYTEYRDGTGGDRMTLRHWPVQSVSSVTICNNSLSAIPLPGSAAASSGGRGYFVPPADPHPPGKPQQLVLYGYRFSGPPSSVVISYTAGYGVLAEPQTVPGSGTYSLRVNEPYGRFGADGGVTYASSGTALTAQASAASLSVGQYYADPKQGIYYFSAADAAAAVLITYSFIPADIEQCCLEMVMERYTYKDRIGMKSKSLGGQETVSFDLNAMPKYISQTLQPYKRVIL